MNTNTASTARTVHQPFARPGRAFRTDSLTGGESDWRLATIALQERSSASYRENWESEEAASLADKFTRAEAERVDRFLAANVHDTNRLDALDTAANLTAADRDWLIGQLRLAWHRLETLHDRIDNASSLMNTRYVASAIDYVRWSRRPEAITGRRPARTTASPAGA
ncbi:hypothetical protein [Streptomyces sp. TLI_171]|uniref:hypothetical protein n=1 Tax=Streptomyces sp. TLI_171 TaxID=1938859 RepID=UPI000C187185|nr:hypothetical protein [Streptomyces sp. TLI_171]RKE02928.1 hypothetical protein BX266_7531 [Streptomyces sp. TLI_171]